MHHLKLQVAALAAWVAAVASASLDISAAPRHTGRATCDFTQLAPKLSKCAQIYFPGSDSFTDAVVRWSNLEVPVANVVVVPCTENDVVETVSSLAWSLHP